MTDQNLVKGDAPYPNYLVVDNIDLEGSTPQVSYVKGELATVDADGFLVKLTGSKINGLYQIRNAVTSGLDGDDTVQAKVNAIRTRALLSLPADATKGNHVQINGVDGTGNVVVSAAAADILNVGIGTVFELYLNDARKAAAGALGVVDMGAY